MPTQQYFLNEFFSFPLDSNHTLITTRHGDWVNLSNQEYEILKLRKLEENPVLFKKLEEVGVILTKESTRKVTQHLRIENGFLFAPTNYHVIAVTNKCNFNCVYCHPAAGPEGKEMTENTAQKVLDFIFSIPLVGSCQIVIEGGEPLLKWDLIKFLCEEAKKRAGERNLRLRFSFTTNSSLMTDKIAKEISDLGISPCISLDGPKELHNRHRPFASGEESYDKVIYWAQKLKNDYKIRIHAIPVITNISLKYGAKAIIDEYLKLGQETVFFKPFRTSGRALVNLEELTMKPEDFYNFWKEGVEYCIALNKKGRRARELNTEYLVTNILTPYRRSMCHRRPCGAGLSILSYDSDGTIKACDALRSFDFANLGQVGKDDYPTVRKKAISLLALTPDLIPICNSCPFIAYDSLCLAEVFGRENDIYPKIPRSFDCQWQKMALEYLFRKLAENSKETEILKSWAVAC